MTVTAPITRVPTRIPGFDHLSMGGLPEGRTTLVSGTAGSAKTVFAAQFLAGGIEGSDEAGVFVTFEETPDDVRRNLIGLGWPVAEWEEAGRWAFVDASYPTDEAPLEVGDYDLGALLARIEGAVRRVGATRVSVDSIGSLFSQLSDGSVVRRELLRIFTRLRMLGLTTVLTAERGRDEGPVARFGVEEFAADNVVILRNRREGDRRQRSVEVLKFRGAPHHRGEFPFTIVSGTGISIIPLSALDLRHPSSTERTSSGSEDLDRMLGGGFLRGSSVLVSGSTGTGKTLLATSFVAGGAAAGERTLLLAFEESPQQLRRNARGWGVDYERLEQDGMLRVICAYPESAGLEDHLIRVKDELDEFEPARLAIDGLSALERISSDRSFREFVVGLTAFVKEAGVTALYTATTEGLAGGPSVSEAHVSTITDGILVLRYVESEGQVRRALAVVKMRGSDHDKRVRELTIDGSGPHIGATFDRVTGLISGYAGARPSLDPDGPPPREY